MPAPTVSIRSGSTSAASVPSRASSTSSLGVGVYVDDLYLTTTQNLNLSFYDLGDVQILKGRRARYSARTPSGARSCCRRRLRAAISAATGRSPSGTTIASTRRAASTCRSAIVLYSRLSFNTSNVDGYVTHLLDSGRSDNVDEKSVRYQLRYQPDAPFTADLLTEYGQSHDNGYESITVGCNPQAGYVQNYDSVHAVPYCTQYPPLGKQYEVYGNATAKFPLGGGWLHAVRPGKERHGQPAPEVAGK